MTEIKTKYWFAAGVGVVLMLMSAAGGAAMYATWWAPVPVSPPDAGLYAQPANMPPLEGNLGAMPGTSADFVHAAASARPSVVYIRSRFAPAHTSEKGDFFSNPFRDYFEDDLSQAPPGVASGSGVLISPDGYIATNNHVIEDANQIEVTLFDNRTYEARVIGTDLSTDLALLKIEGADLPFMTFGNSDAAQVGQWVLAVGNPMDLNSTVTAGIISAKGRNINLLRGDSEFAIESFIQTDAAVNKGNSGGALVGLDGKLIGINTAIASRTGFYAGYSFAIPATIVHKVMEDLRAFGEVRRGFLGVSIQPVNAELAAEKKLSVTKGAYVSEVNADLGAADAGIREGDVIISVNGIAVASSSELQEQVSRFRPGDQIQIALYRGRELRQFSVNLKTLSGHNRGAAYRTKLLFRGAEFRRPEAAELQRMGITAGIMVERPNETMTEAGIQVGYVITQVNGKPIATIEDLEKRLMQAGEHLVLEGRYSAEKNTSYSFDW